MSPEALLKRIVLPALAGLTISAAPCTAAAVDTELVLLVDAQASSPGDFSLILESIAKSFEQQAFQEAVLGGALGRMAASVILFNAPGEQVRVPWVEMSSTLDLNNFAQSVRAIGYPNAGGNVSYSSAINTAAAQLASNQFQGSTRQITIIDDATGFWSADPTGTRAARDAALASSADVINAIVFDAQWNEGVVNNFYGNNVVSPGSGNLAVVSTPQGGNKTLGQIQSVISSVVGTVSQPTVQATAAVPESSSLILLGLGALATLRRRR